MNNAHYHELFSNARLANYTDFNDYLDNVIYSQRHYSKLHFIEIALRNKIDKMLRVRLIIKLIC